MKKIFILISLLILTITSHAQNPNLGTSGAQFLQIPVDARSSGMGGAVVGLTNDASSVFWNPAGLGGVKSVMASFSYINWFDLFDLNAASVAYNTGEAGIFAASIIVFSTGKMEITTEQEPNGTGRFFDAEDISLALSYARFLTDKFSLGLSVKYISQRIWNEVADGIAFDIGTQYRLDFQNLTIAMSMTNFGGDMQYDGPDLDVITAQDDEFPLSRLTPGRLKTDTYPLPLNFQVGIGFDIYQGSFIKVRGAIDAVHPNDNVERIHFGTEFSFFDRFFLRAGYRVNYDDEDFTFGVGANVPFSGSAVYFDYAYAIYDILPSVHRVSFGVSF
jgi:hypothetical protein